MYFLVIALGVPLCILVLAMVVGYLQADESDEVLDWKPPRSPKREAELERADIHQMLATLNMSRRKRDVPELSLSEVAERAQVSLALYSNALVPPNRG